MLSETKTKTRSITKDALDAAVKAAKPGQTIVYAIGNLPRCRHLRRASNWHDACADHALWLSGERYSEDSWRVDPKQRLVHLTQRRLGPDEFEYRATKATRAA